MLLVIFACHPLIFLSRLSGQIIPFPYAPRGFRNVMGIREHPAGGKSSALAPAWLASTRIEARPEVLTLLWGTARGRARVGCACTANMTSTSAQQGATEKRRVLAMDGIRPHVSEALYTRPARGCESPRSVLLELQACKLGCSAEEQTTSPPRLGLALDPATTADQQAPLPVHQPRPPRRVPPEARVVVVAPAVHVRPAPLPPPPQRSAARRPAPFLPPPPLPPGPVFVLLLVAVLGGRPRRRPRQEVAVVRRCVWPNHNKAQRLRKASGQHSRASPHPLRPALAPRACVELLQVRVVHQIGRAHV